FRLEPARGKRLGNACQRSCSLCYFFGFAGSGTREVELHLRPVCAWCFTEDVACDVEDQQVKGDGGIPCHFDLRYLQTGSGKVAAKAFRNGILRLGLNRVVVASVFLEQPGECFPMLRLNQPLIEDGRAVAADGHMAASELLLLAIETDKGGKF